MISLKDWVKGDAQLMEIFDGSLWYQITIISPQPAMLRFPIPFEDTKGAHFYREMRAIELMKWIRKQLKVLSEHD
jgi:hypothetical protein